MSVNSEITRIKNAKAAIKTTLESKDVTVGDGTLDTYASKINQLLSASEYRSLFTGNVSATMTIPDGVDTLKHYLFYGSDLESVTIPDSVIELKGGCFYGCSKLTSITFGENAKLTTIGYTCFEGCTSLTSLTLPKSLLEISNAALNIGSSTNKATIVMKATTPPALYYTAGIGANVEKIIVPVASLNAYKTATNWSAYASIIEASEPVEKWYITAVNATSYGSDFEVKFRSNGTEYNHISMMDGMWMKYEGASSGSDTVMNVTATGAEWTDINYHIIELYDAPDPDSMFYMWLNECATKIAETWVLNDAPSIPQNESGEYQEFTMNFCSNGELFPQMSSAANALLYGETTVFNLDPPAWANENYKTLYLSEAPSGDFCEWLQANGEKQEEVV